MGSSKVITLLDGYREVGDAELICAFEMDGFTDKYVIYSKNEKDKDGNTIIYSGKVVVIDNKQFLENVEGNEWIRLKEIMKSMAKYSLEGENNV